MLAACSEPALNTPPAPAKLAAAREIAAAADREWRVYLGDKASSQYSVLEQITPENVAGLEVAWRYDAGDAAGSGSSEIQHNPLVVRGLLYGSSLSRDLFALNAATGEQVWRLTPPDVSSQPTRGLVYWAGDSGEGERIFYGTGAWLYAVDPDTGQLIPDFGENGRINLADYLGDTSATDTFVAATTPGVIYRDLLIQGFRVGEFSGSAPGAILAFDVRSGALRWKFHTIPAPGEYGADTWPQGAHQNLGGANSWAGMALDEERGLVFAPTGSATFDFYGADRAGNNLFANSLLALDAATGERRWHYQVVRHDLWDRDLPSPPNLVTLNRNGRLVDAVAQNTKSGHTFVFDRDSGQSLFAIREVPVTGSPLPGEQPGKAQPLPLQPPPFTRQNVTRAQLDDRSAAVFQATSAKLEQLRNDGPYEVPSLQGSLLTPGFDGGAEWGGAAWDQASGLLYVNANNVSSIAQMRAASGTTVRDLISPEAIYLMTCAGCHGNDRLGAGIAVPSLRDIGLRMSPLELYRVIYEGRGRMPGFGDRMGSMGTLMAMWYLYSAGDTVTQAADPEIGDAPPAYINAGWQEFLGPDGLPATRPPWGTLSAIDLNRGEIRWQQVLGDYPHALAQGVSGRGAQNYGGPVVTRGGLVFIAATPDEKIRAFHAASGKLLWQHELPHSGFATPAVYEADGRQFLVIAAGGGKLNRPTGSSYIAFSLPIAR
jgi:quinoprotein glucose dehydrogenase